MIFGFSLLEQSPISLDREWLKVVYFDINGEPTYVRNG